MLRQASITALVLLLLPLCGLRFAAAAERVTVGDWHLIERAGRMDLQSYDVEFGDGSAMIVYSRREADGGLGFSFKYPCSGYRAWVEVDGSAFALTQIVGSEEAAWWELANPGARSQLAAAMSLGRDLWLELRSNGDCYVSREFSLRGFSEAAAALQAGMTPADYRRWKAGS